MTITPMPVLPAAGRAAGTPGDGRAGQPSAAGEFAALLGGALAGEVAPGAALGDPAAEPTPPEAPAPDAAAVAGLLGGAVPVAATPDVPAGSAAAAEGCSPLTAPPPAATPTAPPAQPVGRGSGAGTTQQTPPTQPGAVAEDGGTMGGATTPVPPDTVAAPGPESAQRQAAPPARRDAGTATPIPAGVTAPAPVSDVAVTPTGPATSGGPTGPVLAQVTPALARVVSRGDGEHRLMLKLHPADLGELHLTVTVRGDRVDVEIAAGAEAREALREGSAQLRSLLESVGRTSGQLVLRDLPAGPAQPGAALGAGTQDTGPGTSYGGTGDGRRDRPDTASDRRSGVADPATDHPVTTPRTSGRPSVAGASALDVTV